MNKILGSKNSSIGFFAAFLAVFLSAGSAQASFWDWFKAGGDSQQAAVTTKYVLRVNKGGNGSWYRKITSSDGKINCGSDCSERYDSPQTVTLTAASDNAGYLFDKWTGACSGSGSCVVNVNKPNSTVVVTAVFKKTVPTGSSSSSSSSSFSGGASSSSSSSLSSSSSSVQQYTLKVETKPGLIVAKRAILEL